MIPQGGCGDTDTRAWLERRFAREADGRYYAHQPLYGFASPHSEPGHLRRLARTLHLLRVVSRLGAQTMLDVGGGEGYLAHLCRELLGMKAVVLELPVSACERAGELFGLPAVCADAARLPFADGAFDLAVCSEVLEHVEAPHLAAAELARVARGLVLVSTEQFCADAREQELMLKLRDPRDPHPDRNHFTRENLRRLFGQPVYEAAEYLDFLPWDEARLKPAFARRLAAMHSRVDRLHPRTVGVVYLVSTGGELGAPKLDEAKAMETMFTPLVASPYESPGRHPAQWPEGMPRPEGCEWLRPGLAVCPVEEFAGAPAPEWMAKYEMTNVAEGAERERLSREYQRMLQRRILATPEPWWPKARWLAGRAWRRVRGFLLERF